MDPENEAGRISRVEALPPPLCQGLPVASLGLPHDKLCQLGNLGRSGVSSRGQ